ncbi:MAG TPA: Rne/Rng family ribonuclease [Candidatus Brachybacterium intestinipullorum]|uniref:Ribonuclease E n=1 Tax=Candidatus Brachybacterium intestinipullorum TaxID=2838512 RepID=A0A9D2PVR2_9MICO|nr:Rne/Rng family ribonuclease [Candidatus Brachybacterium intestinipullorum]
MADSTQNPENDASTESSEGAPPAPAGRRRRAAGAPAGAPAVTPEPVAAPEETAPRTVVAPQSEQPAEPAPAAPTRRRRRAGAPAGAPTFQAPVVEEPAAEETEPEANPVVDDLRALASARGADEGTASDEDEDRARRREQVQLDFASLLFQAPTPQPRTTVAPQDQDRSDEESDADSDTASEADPSEDEAAAPSRRSRSRSRRSSQHEEDRHQDDDGSGDAEDTGSEDGSDDDTGSDSDSEERSSGSSRRRRRRGGRGRRGRGRGDEEANGAESASDEGSSDQEDASAQDDDSQSEEDGSGSSSNGSSSSSRRRRRRRRSGSSSDDGSSPDDPPNTVVKVREARDEVKAVKGSTRLEAKRQRRREGRDAGRRRNVITEAEFLARRESVKRSMVVRERSGSTQIAVLEDDVLVEHYVAQKSQTSMVGNVYVGKVQNVLPSMEAAFVDIGKGRNAVLYAGEVNWDAVGLEGQPRRIELALKSGDPVLVQVTKDPIGHKGARLTSQISLPGRYVVFVPGGSMTGISRKLPETERSRLKKIMRQIIPEDAGVIVRTAAEGASEQELTRDVERLRAQWEKIQKSQKSRSAPVALSQEPDIAIKVVRDVFNEDFTSLIVEGEKVHRDVHQYVSEVAPDLLERVTAHVPTTPGKDVFAKHRIDEQLLKAMDRKVYLPSGGSLVIDRTEAMTVIDVNTGKFTGSGGSLEETVTKNNLESAEEIVRQLRLRDIGGIIVIDFIDMVLESNRDLVLRRLVECLGRDRTKHQVAEVTSLGLVQMTRKRVGQGLVETFSTTCEHCHGRGLVVDVEGEHHHGGGGNGSEDSSKSSRRRGRRSRGGAKDETEGGDHGAEENGDVHRLEDDETSRAQARATIASIAAASSSASAPTEDADGPSASSPQDPAGKA